MRLRTFESFWLLQNGLLYSYPLLQKKIHTELIVVGGGITGALISDALLDAGYKVVLIDKRDIGQGSTAATTSMLQYEIDVMLKDLAGMIGEEQAALCYRAGIEAVNDMGRLVKKYRIHCGFEKKRSLYFAHSQAAARQLQLEFALRDKYRLGVQWLTDAQIRKAYGLISRGGILSDTAASVDAYKLAHELIARNVKRGLQVYDQTEIADMRFSTRGVRFLTAEGYELRAKKAVFCSGFETTKMFSKKIADLFHTYACVSEQNIELPAKIHDLLLWNTEDPYLYMRTTSDGRFLVGGEDTDHLVRSDQQKMKEQKSRKLEQKITRTMPGLHFVEDFSWGGVFGSTKDGLPYIGKSPEYINALFVLGFGGNGITFSMQGRRLIVDLLQGRDHPLLHLYRFDR